MYSFRSKSSTKDLEQPCEDLGGRHVLRQCPGRKVWSSKSVGELNTGVMIFRSRASKGIKARDAKGSSSETRSIRNTCVYTYIYIAL